MSGRPASTSGPDIGALGCTRTISPFYIDPGVVELSQPSLLLNHLAHMQAMGMKGPFPVGPFRNYNCWACGWQPLKENWAVAEHLWGPIPKEVLPPLLDEVLEAMQKLREDTRDTPGYCWGVGMLTKFLENLKVRCLETCVEVSAAHCFRRVCMCVRNVL